MNLTALLNASSGVEDLAILSQFSYQISENHLPHLYMLGQKQRQTTRNPYDFSVEATVFLYQVAHYLSHEEEYAGYRDIVKNSIPFFQNYFFHKQKDRTQSELAQQEIYQMFERMPPAMLAELCIIFDKNIQAVTSLLRPHPYSSLDRLDAHTRIGIHHTLNNALCCVKNMYLTALKSVQEND